MKKEKILERDSLGIGKLDSNSTGSSGRYCLHNRAEKDSQGKKALLGDYKGESDSGQVQRLLYSELTKKFSIREMGIKSWEKKDRRVEGMWMIRIQISTKPDSGAVTSKISEE